MKTLALQLRRANEELRQAQQSRPRLDSSVVEERLKQARAERFAQRRRLRAL